MKVYDSITGRWFEAKHYQAADKLVEMRKKKLLWDVIDEIIHIWKASKPKEWKAHLIDISDKRETRKDPKFGTSKTESSSFRTLLDIPEKVYRMIRSLYSVDELPMDRKFFREFGKRFPEMKI